MPIIDLVAILSNGYYLLKKMFYGLALVAFVTLVVGSLASFVAAFFYFYNTLDSFITSINSYGSGDTLSKFFGLLTCIGFIQALNDTKSLISSSVTFLLARIVFAQLIYFYFILLRVISPLVQK